MDLFLDKTLCCGCGACLNVCPKSAISMKEDEYGFLYPKIDEEKCVNCGLCVRTCVYGKDTIKASKPERVLALTNKSKDTLMQSTSGGVFAELANAVLDKNGVVYGAAYGDSILKDGVCHTAIFDKSELLKIQGSKYVHSNMGYTMQRVKHNLESGKQVLFSGTPCQIAGLRGYLKRDYDNLLLIDVICHGVPSQKMFSGFVDELQKRINGEITNLKFRDKKKGTGMNGGIFYTDKNRKDRYFCKKGWLFSYFYLFSYSAILRDNCHACPYAKGERYSDITIGDYWRYKEVFKDRPEQMNDINGVSCILINTEKGERVFNTVKDKFFCQDSNMDDIVARNGQLQSPTKPHPMRQQFLEIFKKDGYSGVETLYRHKYKKVIIKSWIGNFIPKTIIGLLK